MLQLIIFVVIPSMICIYGGTAGVFIIGLSTVIIRYNDLDAYIPLSISMVIASVIEPSRFSISITVMTLIYLILVNITEKNKAH